MVRKATNYKPMEETLAEVLHRLKHLEKGQQDIKSHLWMETGEETLKEPKKYKGLKELVYQKQQAISYINNVVMPEIKSHEAEQGDFAAQGLTDWAIAQLAKPVFEYLKAQALEYIGEALAELKKKAIPYAVSMADWILDKLEDLVAKHYQEAEQWQQEEFKKAIEEHFPNSRLLGKLN